MQLLKACMIQDIERMEALGIYASHKTCSSRLRQYIQDRSTGNHQTRD